MMRRSPRRPRPAPDVTVLIPWGGSRRHLAATLWGLAGQRLGGTRMEVVVIRCPSAEGRGGPVEVPARRLAVRWTGFERPGFAPAGARNRGLAAARGDLVVSLDDDMVVPPWFVAAHLRRHRAGRVATFGLRRFIQLPDGDGDGAAGPGIHGRLAARPDVPASASNRPGHRADWRAAEAPVVHVHPHPYHLFHGCNIAYRRADAERAGGWCEDFDGAYGYEDVDFGARLHAAGAAITWVPAAGALHLEGDAAVAVARKADRSANLRLVSARVPGYGEFRHRGSSATRLATSTGAPSNVRSSARNRGGGYAAGTAAAAHAR